MNTSIQDEIKRCKREIAQIEAALLAGHPDVAGLCLALSDWSAEIRILDAELAGRQDTAEDEKSRQPEGRRREARASLFPEPVHPVPGVGLRALDLQAHLLAQGSAQEPPDAMRLPAACGIATCSPGWPFWLERTTSCRCGRDRLRSAPSDRSLPQLSSLLRLRHDLSNDGSTPERTAPMPVPAVSRTDHRRSLRVPPSRATA